MALIRSWTYVSEMAWNCKLLTASLVQVCKITEFVTYIFAERCDESCERPLSETGGDGGEAKGKSQLHCVQRWLLRACFSIRIMILRSVTLQLGTQRGQSCWRYAWSGTIGFRCYRFSGEIGWNGRFFHVQHALDLYPHWWYQGESCNLSEGIYPVTYRVL